MRGISRQMAAGGRRLAGLEWVHGHRAEHDRGNQRERAIERGQLNGGRIAAQEGQFRKVQAAVPRQVAHGRSPRTWSSKTNTPRPGLQGAAVKNDVSPARRLFRSELFSTDLHREKLLRGI